MSPFIQEPFCVSPHPSIKGYFVFLHLYSIVELKFTQVPSSRSTSLKNIPRSKLQVNYNMENSSFLYLFSDGLEVIESDQS